MAAGRGGGQWSFLQFTAPVSREKDDSFTEPGWHSLTGTIKEFYLTELMNRIWSLKHKDSHVTRYMTLDKLFNLLYPHIYMWTVITFNSHDYYDNK